MLQYDSVLSSRQRYALNASRELRHLRKLWLPKLRAARADNFTYCTVPASGQDALLFGAVALLIASALQGKLSALWVLIAGAPSDLASLNATEHHIAATVPVSEALLDSASLQYWFCLD